MNYVPLPSYAHTNHLLKTSQEEAFEEDQKYKIGKGLKTNDHFINFVRSNDHLKKMFHMFKPLHIGYYDGVYRNEEGSEKHLTFIGKKIR